MMEDRPDAMDECPLTNEQLAAQLREAYPRLPDSPITDAQRQLVHIAADRLLGLDYIDLPRIKLGKVG